MPPAVHVTTKLHTRGLQSALRQYARLSKSELPDIVNRKAFFIARRACRETKRADPAEIRALRDKPIIGTGTKYTDGIGKKITVRGSIASTEAAGIIQGRRVRAGLAVLPKAELPAAVKKFINARLRSRALFASGWIPAIKRLAAVVKRKGGAPPIGPAVKTLGREKGTARPATPGFRVSAMIANATGEPGKYAPSGSRAGALQKFGLPALQRAIDAETAGTLAEIERRLKAAARTSGLKTN